MGEEKEEKHEKEKELEDWEKGRFVTHKPFDYDMAEALANLPLGGYEEAFVNEVDEDLLCPICQLTLREPFQTKCGHRFCNLCLGKHCLRYAFFHVTLGNSESTYV